MIKSITYGENKFKVMAHDVIHGPISEQFCAEMVYALSPTSVFPITIVVKYELNEDYGDRVIKYKWCHDDDCDKKLIITFINWRDYLSTKSANGTTGIKEICTINDHNYYIEMIIRGLRESGTVIIDAMLYNDDVN